jgi:hypothetical protein
LSICSSWSPNGLAFMAFLRILFFSSRIAWTSGLICYLLLHVFAELVIHRLITMRIFIETRTIKRPFVHHPPATLVDVHVVSKWDATRQCSIKTSSIP